MAITEILASPDYAMPGQEVVLSADITVGNLALFGLVSKPISSNLELWDAGKTNSLQSIDSTHSKFTPDVDGVYGFTCAEYTETIDVPHFSNDGGVGLYKGLSQRALIGTRPAYVHVGRDMTRQIGVPPDTCTLHVRAHARVTSILSPTQSGVITCVADESVSPTIGEPSSDRSEQAMRSADVATAIAAIGGVYNGTRYSGALQIMPWQSVASSTLIDDFGYQILRLNSHIRTQAFVVHWTPDLTNSVTSPDCAVGGSAGQETLLNEIRSDFLAHSASTSYHILADVTSVVGIGAALSSSTLAQRITRANELKTAYEIHRVLMYQALDLAYTDQVHGQAGQGSGDSENVITLADCADEATMVALANSIKAKYNLHIALDFATGVSNDYHVAAGGSNSVFARTRPTDQSSYIAAVNEWLDVLNDHVLNREHATGTATTYHTTPDDSGRTDTLGRASTFEQAVVLHELGIYLLNKHVSNAGNVHKINTNQGWWSAAQTGIGAINEAFFAALTDARVIIPPNELTAAHALIHQGGFNKV